MGLVILSIGIILKMIYLGIGKVLRRDITRRWNIVSITQVLIDITLPPHR